MVCVLGIEGSANKIGLQLFRSKKKSICVFFKRNRWNCVHEGSRNGCSIAGWFSRDFSYIYIFIYIYINFNYAKIISSNMYLNINPKIYQKNSPQLLASGEYSKEDLCFSLQVSLNFIISNLHNLYCGFNSYFIGDSVFYSYRLIFSILRKRQSRNVTELTNVFSLDMPIHRFTVDGYEAVKDTIAKSTGRILVFFSGSHVNGKSWCPDCVAGMSKLFSTNLHEYCLVFQHKRLLDNQLVNVDLIKEFLF
uniref:DUF953 domain-containing protein n=1 Tax=Heterorhabditis bacteriophora TaxID=37862 RepID=A0A1I7WZF2_HETBA